MNEQALRGFEAAAAIAHPGRSGHAREQVLRDFLQPLVPDLFGVELNAFVIDPSGAVSKEQDIVIYRRDYHPVFRDNGVSFFMAESVAAVVQSRARIGSRRDLHSALDNIVSTKRLDRTDGGTNYIVVGGTKGPPVDPNAFAHQIFGAIVSGASMEPRTTIETWQSHLASTRPAHWPNFYADAHTYTVHYMNAAEDGAITDPNVAEYLTWSRAATSAPLVLLAQELVSFLRLVPTIDFRPQRYFPKARYGPGSSVHLRPEAPHHRHR